MKGEKEYIQTSMMLETIRGMRAKVLLNEGDEVQGNSSGNEESIAITDDPKFGQNALTLQKNALQNAVNSGAKFPSDTPLVYFPEDGNLVFSGEIPSMNLKFQYSKNSQESAPFVWVEGMALNPENVKTLNKLYGYFLNWKEQWEKESGTLENLKK